jgi:hypothetical protein
VIIQSSPFAHLFALGALCEKSPSSERPDKLDLNTLDAFLGSRAGKIYAQRVAAMAERHVRHCQDGRASIESIRMSQGALEAITAVLGLPEVLRREVTVTNGQ